MLVHFSMILLFLQLRTAGVLRLGLTTVKTMNPPYPPWTALMWLCEYNFRTIEILLMYASCLIGFPLLTNVTQSLSEHVSSATDDETPPPPVPSPRSSVWHPYFCLLSSSTGKQKQKVVSLVTVKKKHALAPHKTRVASPHAHTVKGDYELVIFTYSVVL